MKKIAIICLFVLLFAALIACGGSGDIDEALVGEWLFEGTADWTYIFNADGSGERGAVEIQTFTWSVRNNDRIEFNFGAGFQNQTWDYTITGDTLHMANRGGERESFNYFRIGNSTDLPGTWAWTDSEELQFIFNADGTGSHNFLGFDSAFEWFTARENLIIDNGPHEPNEHWHFDILVNTLTIESRQVAGLTLSYMRVN
ncbi:MAG: hypothetical protein FWC90_01080 [Oscillospiraceae bacterium]|nr:hypothetical protein [Oscillospiraceae bacterium]